MIPLPVNPTVVVFTNPFNNVDSIQAVGNNIDPNLNVVVVHSNEEYAEAIKGIPFDSANPCS